jgi:hypothetical protein
MASIDNTPSQSLINAAFASLALGGSVAATAATTATGALFGPVAATAATIATGMLLGPVAASTIPALVGSIFSGINIVQVYHSMLVPSVSATGQSIPRQTLQGPLKVDMNCLAPEFNHDFTKICDAGKTHRRGNQPYERPCGSYRIALNVKDKFGNDNVWLGMTETNSGEWPVSYHGTAQHNALSIAEEGYKLSKGERDRYGKGIYSTPEVAVAKIYAVKFKHERTSYSCILQNRVNPKYLKVISKKENGRGTYWLSAADTNGVPESDLLRPYGICLFKEH